MYTRFITPGRVSLLLGILSIPYKLVAQGGAGGGGGNGGGQACVKLLAPFSDQDCVPLSGSDNPLGTLLTYTNTALVWVTDVSMGICVVWTIIAGIMIMISGNNTSLRERGKDWMTWAIIGFLILLFAGLILRQLNSLFYT